MALAPEQQRRRLGDVELLQAAPPAPAESLSSCLGTLQQAWHRDAHLAALWQDWPEIAGHRLAPHCRPLQLQRGLLTIGASHPQWRQALQYHKPQLLTALRQAGHAIKDLRIQQHHGSQPRLFDDEVSIWSRHPSRADVHGMGTCPDCGRPAPNGEMKLWGHCGFCHRQIFSQI